MTITYKPLTAEHKDQLIELLTARPQVFNGYTDDNFKNSIISRVDEFFSSPLYFLPGLFVDDKLLGTIIIKESEGSPSWTWGHWVIYPGFTSTMYSAEGVKIFKHADQELFNEMEVNRGLNRFFVAYKQADESSNLKNAGMSDRLFMWMSKNNFRVSRYKFITDCVTEANEIAKYPYQQAILGARTWPFRTTIRLGVLVQ